jgi:hypothetical protein
MASKCGTCNKNWIDGLAECWDCFRGGVHKRDGLICECGVHIQESSYNENQNCCRDCRAGFDSPAVKVKALHVNFDTLNLYEEINKAREEDVESEWDVEENMLTDFPTMNVRRGVAEFRLEMALLEKNEEAFKTYSSMLKGMAI